MASLITAADRNALIDQFGISDIVVETLPDEVERDGTVGQRWRVSFVWNSRSISVKFPGRPSRAFAVACLTELVPGAKGGWL